MGMPTDVSAWNNPEAQRRMDRKVRRNDERRFTVVTPDGNRLTFRGRKTAEEVAQWCGGVIE